MQKTASLNFCTPEGALTNIMKTIRSITFYVILFAGISFVSAVCCSETLAQTADSCINNTESEGQCKD
jgi:hypothetical protein